MTDTMKAIVLVKFGGFDAFELSDVAVPVVGPRQVRVRVHASAINPLDYQIRRGDLNFPDCGRHGRPPSLSEAGRVENRRGGVSLPVGCWRRFRVAPSVRTGVAPSPVPAHQTGRADCPHPAFTRPVRPSLSAGRCVAVERGRGRVSRRDTRLGSGGTQRLVVPNGASTSSGFDVPCIPE